LINLSHALRIKKRFDILVLLRRSSNLTSTRQGVHAVETSRLGSFRENEINTDVLAVIGEGACNHHPKEVIALGYNTK
jgi:hypothetical protein